MRTQIYRVLLFWMILAACGTGYAIQVYELPHAEYVEGSPIEFSWQKTDGTVYLKIWRKADYDGGKGTALYSIEIRQGSRCSLTNHLATGEYRWGVTAATDETPEKSGPLTVVRPKGTNEVAQGADSSDSPDEDVGTPPPPQKDVQVVLLESRMLPKTRDLPLRWQVAGKDARSIASYEIILQDAQGKVVSRGTQKAGATSTEIPMGQLSGVHYVTVQALDSSTKELGKLDRQRIDVPPAPVAAPEQAPRIIALIKRVGKTAGIIVAVVLAILFAVLGWMKLWRFSGTSQSGSQTAQTQANRGASYVRTERLEEWTSYLEGLIQTHKNEIERGVASVKSSVQQVSTQISSAKQDATLAKQSAVHEIQKLRTDLAGYVTTSQMQSYLDDLAAQHSSALKELNQHVAQQIQDVQRQLSSLHNDLQAIRNERLAEKNAAVVEASKHLESLLQQVGKGLPRDAASLINGLASACYAEALPQLMKVAQRLLNEVCSSEGGKSLNAYVETVNRLHEIRDELNRLQSQPSADAEQRAAKLTTEADKAVKACVDQQSATSVDSGIVEQARRALMKEAAMPYVSIVMGRYQGDGDGAYQQIKDVLQNLGLELIDIVVGQTRPDSRLHDVQSSMSSDKYPPGTIANVVRMGYTNRATGEVSKAQVIVAQ